MLYRSGRAVALRIEHKINARACARLAAACFIAMFGALLSGCAEDPKYPSLTKISDLENILSPEDRQKAVQEMQKQEQTHSSDAIKAIEKPDQ
jgi:hypothetical protein